ncbi:MAG: hypothetical protein CR991_06420 [Proteobacteria bacterium]|nr:MAG: hypothetical protein CR991_06420 [Pseudomonadota bacterium]
MQCFVYRNRYKLGTFLFLAEKDNFSQVPESLLQLFGVPEFSFEFELTPGRKLVQADADEIKRSLETNGFFLQLPPSNEVRC